MKRTFTLSALCAAAFLLVAGPVFAPAAAGAGGGRGHATDTCVYTAHGSAAERTENAKGGAGSGGGGGGKQDTCSKTYARWTKSNLNVYLDASGGPGAIDAGTYGAYLGDALTEWACNSGLGESVTITFLASPTGADIAVGWGNLGSTGILGQTTTYYLAGVISSSTVAMNTNQAAFLWTAGPAPALDADGCAVEAANGNTNSSNYDFLSVLTHEIGHSLGISHPNRRCSASDHCYPETMFSCTDAEEFMRRALNPGDVLSVSTLYGSQP